MITKFYVESFEDGTTALLAVYGDTHRPGAEYDAFSSKEGWVPAQREYLDEHCTPISHEDMRAKHLAFYMRTVNK